MRNEFLRLEMVAPSEEQIEVLYRQLCTREHKISHNEVPAYEKHSEFVKNNPYRAWYIVFKGNEDIGSFYIQNDNSVGLNCNRDFTKVEIKEILCFLAKNFDPLEPVPSVRAGVFFLNIASANTHLQEQLRSLGLIESQVSFKYEL